MVTPTKTRTVFACQQCGAEYSQWGGQCRDCGEWNSLVEMKQAKLSSSARKQAVGYAGVEQTKIVTLDKVDALPYERWQSSLVELDRVLGGGIVPGSVVLVGGDPGVGKSTLLLQTLCQMSSQYKTLYITGEESLGQVALRARRLGLPEKDLNLFAATQVEPILATAQTLKPEIMVVDSIQTLYSEQIQSSPGSVSQVRESAAQLVRYAKQTGTALFFIGHVTKEGALAGPRILEHMVDAVLYFEGSSDSRYRMIRAVKNRFGAVNELGVFAMTEQGLKEIKNPSAMFLSGFQNTPGSAVMVTWEGTRPLLLEIQALVTDSQLGNPRRVTVGLDQSRLAMLLAVLQRHAGVTTCNQDVFANVVSGVRITETAADLALIVSVLSSYRDRPLPEKTVVFGEIGLAGEVRPIQCGVERLKEAEKHGFIRAIVPKANAMSLGKLKMEVLPVSSVQEAINIIS